MTKLAIPVVDGFTLREWTDDDADVYEDVIDGTDGFLGEIEGPVPSRQGPHKLDNGFLFARCALVRADDPTPIGMVNFGGTAGDQIDLDVAVVPSARGSGAGKAAIRIVNRLVREHLPGTPVVGVVRRDNASCLAMLASLGVSVADNDADPDYLEAR